MAKKIFIFTLVLSIISGIITVAFIPIAIEDISESLIEYNATKEIDKSSLTLQARDNIEKIKIFSWYDRIILEKSTDNSPSVTKDQIAVQFSGYYANQSEDLHYIKDNVFCIRYSNANYNELSLLTRKNAIKTLSAIFNNEERILTVYVPEGIEVYLNNEPYILENNGNIPVFIDNDSSYSENNNIEYKSIDPNREQTSSSSSIPVIAPNSSSISITIPLKTADEVRTSLTEIMNKHNELYKIYIRGEGTEDYIRTELLGTIDTEIEILKTVNTDIYNYLSDENNRNHVIRVGELFIEKNILEIKSEMLEDNYKKGLITKTDYYTQDLEIDQQEDLIELEQKSTNDIIVAIRTLRDLQNLYSFRIPMLYDID